IAKLRLLQVPQLRRNARLRVPRHRPQFRQRQPRATFVRAQHDVAHHVPLRPHSHPHPLHFSLPFHPHTPSSFLRHSIAAQETLRARRPALSGPSCVVLVTRRLVRRVIVRPCPVRI